MNRFKIYIDLVDFLIYPPVGKHSHRIVQVLYLQLLTFSSNHVTMLYQRFIFALAAPPTNRLSLEKT